MFENLIAQMVIDPPQAPDAAMQRDLFLLKQYGSGTKTIFRFYSWEKPTISLGRLQDSSILDMKQVHQDGVAVVVRPTGGRHVFHKNDICISIIIPKSQELFWGNSIRQRQISVEMILRELLNRLGIDSLPAAENPSRDTMKAQRSLPCFLSSVQYEPHVREKKIAGIAQLTAPEGGLIQCSIPITNEYLAITKYENVSHAHRNQNFLQLSNQSTSLNKEMPDREFSFETVVNSAILMFSK